MAILSGRETPGRMTRGAKVSLLKEFLRGLMGVPGDFNLEVNIVNKENVAFSTPEALKDVRPVDPKGLYQMSLLGEGCHQCNVTPAPLEEGGCS